MGQRQRPPRIIVFHTSIYVFLTLEVTANEMARFGDGAFVFSDYSIDYGATDVENTSFRTVEQSR